MNTEEHPSENVTSSIVWMAGFVSLVAIGCGGSDASGPVTANPYDNSPAPAPAAAPEPPAQQKPVADGEGPKQAAPARSQVTPARHPSGASRPLRSPASSTPAEQPVRTSPVRDGGAQAVQLSLSQYSQMARDAAEILDELAEIHVAVDESGDSGPHQERWGELTADLTQLHREVRESGYPPPHVVDHLKESWLIQLDDAIAKAALAIQQHTSVESGIKICHKEAEEISDHLSRSRDETD